MEEAKSFVDKKIHSQVFARMQAQYNKVNELSDDLVCCQYLMQRFIVTAEYFLQVGYDGPLQLGSEKNKAKHEFLLEILRIFANDEIQSTPAGQQGTSSRYQAPQDFVDELIRVTNALNRVKPWFMLRPKVEKENVLLVSWVFDYLIRDSEIKLQNLPYKKALKNSMAHHKLETPEKKCNKCEEREQDNEDMRQELKNSDYKIEQLEGEKSELKRENSALKQENSELKAKQNATQAELATTVGMFNDMPSQEQEDITKTDTLASKY